MNQAQLTPFIHQAVIRPEGKAQHLPEVMNTSNKLLRMIKAIIKMDKSE
jgi:hypothetical protein